MNLLPPVLLSIDGVRMTYNERGEENRVIDNISFDIHETPSSCNFEYVRHQKYILDKQNLDVLQMGFLLLL